MQTIQETINSIMLSTADAVLGAARQSSLDKIFQELADEVIAFRSLTHSPKAPWAQFS